MYFLINILLKGKELSNSFLKYVIKYVKQKKINF